MSSKKSVIIEEEIRHGDTDKTRYIDVDLTNIDAVIEMLNTCSYLRLPEPDFGKGAVLVSRTYDQIVSQRRADAERIAQELTESGEAEIGWVSYAVVPERPWWA
jgi:hypothetical protein